jgi:hypothetical protein
MAGMGFVSLILSTLGYAFLLRLMLPKMKNGAALFSASYGIALLLYTISLLLGLYQIGAQIILYTGITLLPICWVYNIIKRRLPLRELFSVGTILYLIGAAVFAVMLRDCVVTRHDEVSRWATVVKEFYYTSAPMPNLLTVCAHEDYPMILSMVQYGAVSLFGYNEAVLFMVTAILRLAILVWLADSLPKRYISVPILLLFFLVNYPLLSGNFSIDTLLADSYLFMLPSAFLILWFRRPEKPTLAYVLPLLICLAVLPSAKIASGSIFAFLCVIIMALTGRKPYRRITLVALFLVLFAHCSWCLYCNINAIHAEIASTNTYNVFNNTNILLAPKTISFRDFFLINNVRTDLALDITTTDRTTVATIAIQTLLALWRSFLPQYLLALLLLLSLMLWLFDRDMRRWFVRTLISIIVLAVPYCIGTVWSFVFYMHEVSDPLRYFAIPILMVVLLIAYGLGMLISSSKGYRRMILAVGYTLFILVQLLTHRPDVWIRAYFHVNATRNNLMTYTQDISQQVVSMCNRSDQRVLIMDFYMNGSMPSTEMYHAYGYYSLPISTRRELIATDRNRYEVLSYLNDIIHTGQITKIFFIKPDNAFRAVAAEQFVFNDALIQAFEVCNDEGIVTYKPLVSPVSP